MQFDLVILDEDAAAWLLETIPVTPQDVALWRRLLAECDTSGTYATLDKFLVWLQNSANDAASHVERNREQPALVALRQTAPDDAATLVRAAIGSCTSTINNDLAMTLIKEWTCPEDADSRLRYAADGTLILRRPFMHLVNTLAQRRVLWLDATADVAHIKRMAQNAQPYTKRHVPAEVYDLTITPDVTVWQITDSRFNPDTLRRGDSRELHAIPETITSVARASGIGDLRRVAVLARKPFDPTAEETCEDDAFAAFTTGHFGKDDKATDRFKDCDMLVTVGSYTPNIGAIEARVAAWRYADHAVGGDQTTRRVVRYPGTQYGIETACHPDPDVQAAIDQATWVHETQALGRLRAVRRAAGSEGKPLIWLRFNNVPYSALPVTRLVSHNALREEYGLALLERLTSAKHSARHCSVDASGRPRRHDRRSLRLTMSCARSGATSPPQPSANAAVYACLLYSAISQKLPDASARERKLIRG